MAPTQLSSNPKERAGQIAAAIDFNKSRPNGARKSASPPPRSRKRKPLPPVDHVTREAELAKLPELIKEKFKSWKDGAREFQLEAMRAQVLQRDIIVHAATGSGKTGIAAGPHLLPCMKGRVTLFTSPLIALQNEQVTTFQEEFGLKAIAINSSSGGVAESVFRDIVAGEYQIVILSPEMLQTIRFREGVLVKPEFTSRVLSVFVDEAHCVSHWGDSFRKKYGILGAVRAYLPRSTPYIAVSASLTEHVRRDIISKLEMDSSNYLYLNMGNDRTNVAHVVRAMEHPMNTYADIDFVIPDNITTITDIPLTFTYTDEYKAGAEIVDHLNGRVPDKFRNLGLVRPYNAAMSDRRAARSYRHKTMALFKAGIIRVLVCTDAAGMGCNIPNIDRVVQWRLPPTLSAWVQRAGRAARAPNRKGLAVLLVERSAFSVDPCTGEDADTPKETAGSKGAGKGTGRSKRRRAAAAPTAPKLSGDYAAAHGLKRGSASGQYDYVAPEQREEPELTANSPREGLYVYIQTTHCRRAVVNKVFGNASTRTVEASLCCDLCNAQLFNGVRAGPSPPKPRASAIKKHPPDDVVRQALLRWRRETKKTHFATQMWPSAGILDGDTIELLASTSPVVSMQRLQMLLGGWKWWDKLGNELYECLCACRRLAERPVDVPGEPAAKRARAPSAPSGSDLVQTSLSATASPTKRARRVHQDEIQQVIVPPDAGTTATASSATPSVAYPSNWYQRPYPMPTVPAPETQQPALHGTSSLQQDTPAHTQPASEYSYWDIPFQPQQ